MATRSIDGLEALLERLHVGVPIPTSVSSDVLWKPIDIYRSYLADMTAKALGCDACLAYEAIQGANVKDNSDLTLVLPKLKWGNYKPKDLAKQAFTKFSMTPLFQVPIPDGVHLRFVFSNLTLPHLLLSYINDRTEENEQGRLSYGQPLPLTDGTAKKVVIEFSSPNLATKFNSHHLRSTVLGAQLSNLYESMGWDVVRLNFLGDWGKELGLLGVGWKKFGSEEAFQENPMGHLHYIYEKINEQFKPEKENSRKARDEGRDTAEIERQGIFAERDGFSKRMEDGDSQEIDFWKRVRDASIAYYTNAYGRLGIKFNEFSGESQVSPESIAEVESVLKEKCIYEESDGSWIIDYTKHGPKSLGVSVLRGRTGSTTYLLRDIAAVFDRYKKYSFDKMIYVATAEQDIHFQKVFQAIRYMGQEDLASRLEHVGFGKVQGLSKQLGEVHLLGQILDQSTKEALEALEKDPSNHAGIAGDQKSAEIIGVTSLIAQLCGTSKRATSFTVNTQRFVSFEGDTGPNIQLCYRDLSAKISESDSEETVVANVDYTYLQEDLWMDVICAMAQYPDAVDAAFKSHEPSMILTYLFRLCEELRNCLDDEDDQDGNEDKGKTKSEEPSEAILAQTVLYKHARQVLRNGMALLGISPIS
ncbi:arginyl-tRNA synthetase [Rostrohypoxylon terebratum]|nr:arginyl-tRNA synthetase [Rostrohypoxylon terebratum]